MRHVESHMNSGGPSSKAKYKLVTDSEPVPWGKDEKNRDNRSEIVPEIICLQSVRELWTQVNAWERTFCIMSQRVTVRSKVKSFLWRSRRETKS